MPKGRRIGTAEEQILEKAVSKALSPALIHQHHTFWVVDVNPGVRKGEILRSPLENAVLLVWLLPNSSIYSPQFKSRAGEVQTKAAVGTPPAQPQKRSSTQP
jgi:hypothetical protein